MVNYEADFDLMLSPVQAMVASICFTAGDKYLISIGGEDDGSVIVFDMESRYL